MQRRTITIKQFKLKTMDKIKLELDKNQERLVTQILIKASQEAYQKGNQLNVLDIKCLLNKLEFQKQQ